MINWKFILTATFTFIPYTALWFFWHNNLFPQIYYSLNFLHTIQTQNIWLMNFANALMVYGFVYFYFKTVKPETKLYQSVLWGVYYNISVTGFFSFMMLGIMKEWNPGILLLDLTWAVIGGAVSGAVVNFLYARIKFSSDK